MDKQPIFKKEQALREEEIQAFWEKNDIFEKSIAQDAPNGSFVFYDGPPFGTGAPHYGHLLAGTIKDIFPRYETMRGKQVHRKWGWDCHGLPVENLIEKKFDLKNKKDIEEFGIGKFNTAAKESVLEFSHEWEHIVPRSGRWVDMKNDYKTMDVTYSESIWWAFKELHAKGLIYEGYKSMHLCPRCETTLSNFEVNLGYKDITDISVYAKFKLLDEENTYILAWTTTPWTLPGNVTLAISKDITYVKIKIEDAHYILAEERLSVIQGEYTIVQNNVELVGRAYAPIFDFYQNDTELVNRENGWKVYEADFVTTDTGTGVVHIAPAFGDDDMQLGKKLSLPFIQHVGTNGHFKDDFVTGFKGLPVKPKDNHQATDIEIIKWLAHNGFLFEKLKIVHSYPHCWRCDTPLLNYASTSWFVKVEQIRDRLVEENKKINWVPEHIKEGRFGKWLEGAHDWAISRSRYWGAPLPVWKSEVTGELFVAGSIEDITQKTKKSGNSYFVMRHGEAPSNIDETISFKNEDTNGLTEKGKEQVLASVASLKNEGIDLIITSPFRRTKESADIVQKELGLSEDMVICDERLIEMNPGVLDGGTWDTHHAQYPKTETSFSTKPEGGESYTDVKKRVSEFLYEIEKTYSNKKILIVTHGGPAWLLVSGSRGYDTKKALHMIHDNWSYIQNGEVQILPFTPLPHNEAYELDLHRPYIDDYDVLDQEGFVMQRIPEVFDCWFESGSMPFAQFHYPFENKEVFEKNYPADFIAEGLDQTRGWFYSLLILGTALFDKAPYKQVIVNGLVLAEDGQKMSKKLQNYPDLSHTINTYGADALRLYVSSSPVVHGEELRFSEKDLAQVASKIVGRVYNVATFYTLYRNTEIENDISLSKDSLDVWMHARIQETITTIDTAMAKYELDRAVRAIDSYVDDLSTWYVRRSRDRLKDGNTDAIKTMYQVLKKTAQVLAPFAPFISEMVWHMLKSKQDVESVHLTKWPKGEAYDEKVLSTMEETRALVTLGLEARQKAQIKVRQPLWNVTFKNVVPEEYLSLITEELNVKNVSFDTNQSEEVVLDTEITKELKQEGDYRELVRFVQDMRKKQGLSPSDTVTIMISKNAEEFVGPYSEEFAKTVQARDVLFTDTEGEILTIDQNEYYISLVV